MKLKIIESGKKSAQENMEYDRQLLLSLDPASTSPILHFYDWQEPSATFGYFSNPYAQLDAAAVQKWGLHLARRPTGGGIIFHQFDFAFSFLLPASHPQFSLNTLENYRLVNTLIADVILQLFKQTSSLAHLESLELQPCATQCTDESVTQKQLRNFCMALPTVYDVICGDFKLAGGAQRKTKLGLLHQASIALMLPPDKFLDEVLGFNSTVAKAMKKHSFHLLEMDATYAEQKTTKDLIKNLLTQKFEDRLASLKLAKTCYSPLVHFN